jgi:hypothetical protein
MTLGISPARSPLEPTASGPGSLPEAVLVRGYGGLEPREPRTEACACGGAIDATYRPVPEAVADHQGTLEHRAWRAAGGLG